MKILVGYDGSKPAINALKLAQQHAKTWNAKTEVISVITRSEPMKFCIPVN
jgi:nucleotide-binding universal stress UspA family protein